MWRVAQGSNGSDVLVYQVLLSRLVLRYATPLAFIVIWFVSVFAERLSVLLWILSLRAICVVSNRIINSSCLTGYIVELSILRQDWLCRSLLSTIVWHTYTSALRWFRGIKVLLRILNGARSSPCFWHTGYCFSIWISLFVNWSSIHCNASA